MSDKLVIVVADANIAFADTIADKLRKAVPGSTVYTANDGKEAIKKVRNVPPKLLITGLDLGKNFSGIDLCREVCQEKEFADLPILVLSDVPDHTPAFASDVARGRMKFLSSQEAEMIVDYVNQMLKLETIKANEFHTLSLDPGQILFTEGEPADKAFLVKSGKLQASRNANGKTVVLGEVAPGEFVGEMAHITGEARAADVKALEATELVVIPCGTLDLLIFSKPTWTKALLKTLCRRLREANAKRT